MQECVQTLILKKKKKSFVVDHLKVFIEFEPLSFKWLSCAVLCLVVFDSDPMDCSPLGSSIHADSPDKNTKSQPRD